MDYDYRHQQQGTQFEAEHQISSLNGLNNEDEDDYYGDHHQQQQQQHDVSNGIVLGTTQSMSHHTSREKPENSSYAGKLFVGGISWETSEETFTDYFSKYGEIADAVIMTDRHTGRPRGFGFVTFADTAVAEKVLKRDHVIDGRLVEVKRTIPREETEFRGIARAKKIFIGGIPPTLTEDDLREYFSFYGSIVEHQILIDHKTGRSRGFGFVTFDSEDAVEKIFAEGKVHELGGKMVEIKKAEPKRGSGDYGSFTKSYSQFDNGSGGYPASHNAGNQYVGKVGRGFGNYGGYGDSAGFGGYGSAVGYGGGYGGYGAGYMGSAGGFYGPFGGYGYGLGFNGPMMYGAGGYGGNGYGGVNSYGAAPGYGSDKGYGRSSDGFGNSKGYGSGSDKRDGHNHKGYTGNMNAGSGGSGRYHPYQK